MSLNVFIDVDGTLLNQNENVAPQAKEVLQQMKRSGANLFLWSGAGADYARSKAEEHGVAGYFSGFAGKPDVIVDDEPSSVFPRRTIVWHDDTQWQQMQKIVFADAEEFSPGTKLVELVSDIKDKVNETDEDLTHLYERAHPYPLPFFGDLENAEVLTVAVNPSPTEFQEDRNWPVNMDARHLAFRLVNYFRLWNPPPNAWFTSLETKLRLKNCSYSFNSAHIDLSPRATRRMTDFKNDPTDFRSVVSEDASRWFSRLLDLAKRAKKIRFCRTMLTATPGGQTLIGSYIGNELPELWTRLLQFQCDAI